MGDLPTGFVVHAMRGRLRVRVPDRRRDADYFAGAAAHLAACPGITAVEAKSLTGSLLITHTVDAAAVDAYARAGKLFAMTAAPAPVAATPPSEQWLAAVASANRHFAAASGGRGDLRTMLAASFLVMAMVQAARGRIAVPAISALWYALRALSLGQRWPDEP